MSSASSGLLSRVHELLLLLLCMESELLLLLLGLEMELLLVAKPTFAFVSVGVFEGCGLHFVVVAFGVVGMTTSARARADIDVDVDVWLAAIACGRATAEVGHFAYDLKDI